MLRRSAALILSLAAAACATSPKPTVSTPPATAAAEERKIVLTASKDETFVGELGTASSPGLRVTLTLAAGGSAFLSIDFLNGTRPIAEAGTWKAEGIDLVRVELKPPAAGGKGESPLLFFRDGLVLTAREWNRDEWGSDPLRLKICPLVGKWKDRNPVALALEFLPDGRIQGSAEEKRVTGRWTASPRGALSIELAGARPASKLVEALPLVRSYHLEGDELSLDGQGGGAIRLVRAK